MDMRLQMPQTRPMNMGPDWNYIQNIQKLAEMKKQREEEEQYKNALMRISNPQYETVQQEPPITEQIPQEEAAAELAARKTGIYDQAQQEEVVPKEQTSVQQVKPFVPATYPEFQAARDYSNKFMEQVKPFIDRSFTAGNDSWLKAISQKARNTGLKPLQEFADMLDQVQIAGPKKLSMTIDVGNEQKRNDLYNKYKSQLDEYGATIDSIPLGMVTVSLDNGKITSIGPARTYGKSEEELRLYEEALELRKKAQKTREAELGLKYDPETRGAIKESEMAGAELGKMVPTADQKIEELESILDPINGRFANLRKLVNENPGAFGGIAKLKIAIAGWTNPKFWEDTSEAIEARRKLSVEVTGLFDKELKSMFGPPFSDSDLKVMREMTGADLSSPASINAAINKAESTTNRELRTQYRILQKARPTTSPRITGPRQKPTQEGLNIPSKFMRQFEEFRFKAIKEGFTEKQIAEYANKKWGKQP